MCVSVYTHTHTHTHTWLVLVLLFGGFYDFHLAEYPTF